MSHSFRDAFMEALGFFFRRRPPLDALMWHLENIPAGKTFTVPPDKIYEVYVHCPSAITPPATFAIDGILCGAESNVLGGVWLPLSFALVTVMEWTLAGAVYSPSALETMYSTAPHGWRLSKGQVLSEGSASAFKVLWRDVTHLQ